MRRSSRADYVSLSSQVKIDGDLIEVVDEFLYFGPLVTAGDDTSKEIQSHIMDRNRAYYGRIKFTTPLFKTRSLLRPLAKDLVFLNERWWRAN